MYLPGNEWILTNYSITSFVPPDGGNTRAVAVDTAGAVYVSDWHSNSVLKWLPASDTWITLVSSNLSYASGLAVDTGGNVYIADSGNHEVKEWQAQGRNVVSVAADDYPAGIAVDVAADIYIAQPQALVEEWTPANNTLNTIDGAYINYVTSQIAVDGSGNIYYSYDYSTDPDVCFLYEWVVASNTLVNLISAGLSDALGVAVDANRNVYVADAENQIVLELPRAFVDPTPKLEGLSAGSDSLPPVLPITENLLPPFAPACDQAWLTLTGISNGVVNFSFTANPGPARTAHISVLGQTIPVTQGRIGISPVIDSAQWLESGAFQLSFTNISSASFTVLSSTNLSLPLSEWTVAGAASEGPPGIYQFTDAQNTNSASFYVIRSP